MMAAGVVNTARQAGREITRLPPLPTIGEILRLYRLNALKHLSQNFLLDQKLNTKIVKAAGSLEKAFVLEIGPGPGSLTRPILEAGPREVCLIEKDPRFFPVLGELRHAVPNIPINLIQGDIMKYDLQDIFPHEEASREWEDDKLPPVHVIANLPFNISTPLIARLLHTMSTRTGIFRYGRVKLTLMFQHEVAQRIIADEGNPQRCRLSVMCQNYCDVKYAFPIKGSSFVPKPEVSAGVVTFIPKKDPILKQPFKIIERVIRNIFNGRRRKYSKTTKLLFPESHIRLADDLAYGCKIDPTKPAYLLSLEEFNDILRVYEQILADFPELAHYQVR